MNDISIAILAAGEGKRLGGLKQLAPFDGETFLARAMRVAIEANLGKVYVVTGYKANELSSFIEQDQVSTIVNHDWQEGIASSIRAAVNAVEATACRALVFMAIDQPFVDSVLLNSIADAFKTTGKSIVASDYGTPGIPALFARETFPRLLELKGDKGAKQLINESDAHLIEAPRAQFDIDTREDFETVRRAYQTLNQVTPLA